MTQDFFAGVGATLLLLLIWWFCQSLYAAPLDPEDDAPPVDPWALQRIVMGASGQKMAALPHLNENVLLYWALIAEEFGETSEALLDALYRAWPAESRTQDQKMMLWEIAHCQLLQGHSRKARGYLAGLGKFDIQLGHKDARALLDGTTDLAVVNSGLALAAGLPAQRGYEAVQVSNLSKRNDAGVIAKTPDGKWIKDPKNYEEPDLDRVLDEHRNLALYRFGLAQGEPDAAYAPAN